MSRNGEYKSVDGPSWPDDTDINYDMDIVPDFEWFMVNL